MALALLGLATLGGIVMRAGLPASAARRFGRSTLTEAHQYLAVAAAVVTALHLVAVFNVPLLRVGWLQIAVPFTRAGGPAAVLAHGCAVIAVYALVAVVTTSALLRRMLWSIWKKIHLLAVPLFALAVAHTVLVETWSTRCCAPALVSASALVASVPLLRARVPTLAAETFPAPLAASAPSPPTHAMSLVISQLTWEADDIMSLRLIDPKRGALPAWTPGAHIEMTLPSGRSRSYSLYGDPADHTCYQIAVLRQDAGRGGSREVHEALRVGRRLRVSPPRNTFPLQPASAYLFIAGGIGITAMLPMARAVAHRGAHWWLLYIGRSRTRMALIKETTNLHPRRVAIIPGDVRGHFNLAPVINSLPPGTAVYGCGPNAMLSELTALVAGHPELSLHLERFACTATSVAGGAPIRLELRRTGRTIEAGPGQTLLHAVRHVAPQLTGGCEQGGCGRCKTTVLDGIPDHRDNLLTAEERESGQMLLCVSRAHGDYLVLDL